MRIGIDFDNTIICYDDLFCDIAKEWQLIDPQFQGTKRELRDVIQSRPDGDTDWQRLQGKVYGEFIHRAVLFHGVKEFIKRCNAENIDIFIVSHKTELGHFDEKKINLRDAATGWLKQQGFFDQISPSILPQNVFFAPTREEKIARIQSLNCTHFIDDLIEVLGAESFPKNITKLLFDPSFIPVRHDDLALAGIKHYTNWMEILDDLFHH